MGSFLERMQVTFLHYLLGPFDQILTSGLESLTTTASLPSSKPLISARIFCHSVIVDSQRIVLYM
jgi:hypothetical protein